MLPWAIVRLTASRIHSPSSSATVPTGIDVWFAEPQRLASPGAGAVLASSPGRLVVALDGGLRLELDGEVDRAPAHGTKLAAADGLGVAAAGSPVRIRLVRADAPAVPHLVRPEYAAGWLALTADPAPLLGLEPPAADAVSSTHPAAAASGIDPARSRTPAAEAAALVARRDRRFAEVQEHYYDAPPRIERGWREHLIGTDGRAYLDMVNNVTPLGHGHPRLADAVAKQLRTLNTNSRFNYGAVVEFSERLASMLPEPLDTVFLVNSGSEAVDLALRVALAATGRRDVVALLEAYHGWTYASDAVSTSVADNPDALATRPDWVHALDAPNPFRGTHRGADAARYRRRPPRASMSWQRPAARRPRSSPRRSPATPAASRCPTATSPRCTRPCGRPAASRSPTRCRRATDGSATGSGDSNSSASCPMSSRSRRPRATAIRSER